MLCNAYVRLQDKLRVYHNVSHRNNLFNGRFLFGTGHMHKRFAFIIHQWEVLLVRKCSQFLDDTASHGLISTHQTREFQMLNTSFYISVNFLP